MDQIFVIIGHSERRINFKEDDEIFEIKIQKVLGDGLRPIVVVRH